MCDKRTYITYTHARIMRRILRRRKHPHRPDYLRVYYCERCEGWHLTSRPKYRINDDRPDKGLPLNHHQMHAPL